MFCFINFFLFSQNVIHWTLPKFPTHFHLEILIRTIFLEPTISTSTISTTIASLSIASLSIAPMTIISIATLMSVSTTMMMMMLWTWVCRFSSRQIASWLVNDRRNRNGNQAQENKQLKKKSKNRILSLDCELFHHLCTTLNRFKFYLQHFFRIFVNLSITELFCINCALPLEIDCFYTRNRTDSQNMFYA